MTKVETARETLAKRYLEIEIARAIEKASNQLSDAEIGRILLNIAELGTHSDPSLLDTFIQERLRQ